MRQGLAMYLILILPQPLRCLNHTSNSCKLERKRKKERKEGRKEGRNRK
jgi:hypothetical protein